jgi:hypothetical protein
MFGASSCPPTRRCACGRDPKETALTTFRSISGTYQFHRCPCGMEWTEHLPFSGIPLPPNGERVMEFHQHLRTLRG